MLKFASSALLFTLFLAFHSAQAGNLWGDGGFRTFTESLPRADANQVEQTLGREWTHVIYRSGLEPNRVHKADWAHIDAVLERSVKAKLGILELFTSIELADPKAPALLLDEDLLQQIDAKYDLSSVWMLSTKTKGGSAGTLKMRYMLVGQGILIMGYPHSATVDILDDGKFLEYQYESLISAKIVNTPTTRGLFGVRTLASPHEEFNDFKGPMGVSIRAYEVKGSRIRVEFHLVVDQDTEVAKRPIIIRTSQALSSP
jgi:hypothetical protein